ncbi:hypothetical protein JWG42_19185 [Desulfoprunum benzoelyticum]|uniref:hypothetical protein n=1 Tax=Desulfoprunum benzoelyticum TaxID=1506996 RepID=UPI001963AC1D|nr:hypothetical protein [Desulfoprunum benzoelyticum]MBM9532283.1 hypothetical protein [Desulfoprunum benzoelyticum]
MTTIDMRNTLDFFGMLTACALIKRLEAGESMLILANDTSFLPDLRRVHPECSFQLVPAAHGAKNSGDYLFQVRKT